jgi:hypothetical protein
MSVTREITIGCSIKLLDDGNYFAEVKGYPCSGSGRTVEDAIFSAAEDLQEFLTGVAKEHVSVRAEILSARAEMLVTVEDTR